jgi:hypothetical protein
MRGAADRRAEHDPASHGMERLADGSQILSAGLG